MPSGGQWLDNAHGIKGALVNLSLISYWVCSLTLHLSLKELFLASSQNFHPHCAFSTGCFSAECIDSQVQVPILSFKFQLPLGCLTHHSSLFSASTTHCASKGQGPCSVSSLRSCRAGSSGNEWTCDGPCSALKMTTLPTILAPAVSSLRSSRFQFL